MVKFVKEIHPKHNERIYYFAESEQLSFEIVISAIKRIIKPDEVSEEEITSWTEGCTFIKDNIEVYFYEFYDSAPRHFVFELFPFGKHSDESLAFLEKCILDLETYFNRTE